MSICPTLESLAIWVDEGHADGVTASHVENCAACKEFVRELRADQDWLRSSSFVSETAYNEVRERVLKQVKVRKTRPYYWVAGAIAAAMVLAMFVPRMRNVRPVGDIAEPPIIAIRKPEPPAVIVPVKGERSTRKPSRRPQRPMASSADLIAAFDRLYEEEMPAAPGLVGDTVITMETQDPEVVVVLLAEKQGDEE